MAVTVVLNSSLPNTVLPNGLRYQGGETVVLSDAEFSELSAGWKTANLASSTVVSTVTLPLSVASGGTGSTTASAARTALGAMGSAGGTFTGSTAPAVSALTDGATIAVNAALGNVFTVTIAGSRTLSNPTSPVSGQEITVVVTQGAGGSHTLSFDTAYDFGTAGAPTLSTSAAKVDILRFQYVAALSKWCFLYSALGF